MKLSIESDVNDIQSCVQEAVSLTRRITNFWGNPHGWAPDSAALLMSKSRLDWHLSLTEVLEVWIEKQTITEGELIMAWANLGALVEGALKLFLSVYYVDYKNDPEPLKRLKKKNGDIKDPDILGLEDLRQFVVNKGLLTDWHEFVKKVQQRRNAIHAYKDRDIGDYSDYISELSNYTKFLEDINHSLPYPGENYP